MHVPVDNGQTVTNLSDVLMLSCEVGPKMQNASLGISSFVDASPKTGCEKKKTTQQDRLKADKDYLKELSKGLLSNDKTDLIGKIVSNGAGQTVEFLNTRNQFWHQVQVKRK